MLGNSAAGLIACLTGVALAQLNAVPSGFNTDRWAWVSNQDPLLAVIPGHFNRSMWEASSAAEVSDSRVAAMSVLLTIHYFQTSLSISIADMECVLT